MKTEIMLSRQRELACARLTALLQDIGQDWINSNVIWQDNLEGIVPGYYALKLPILTKETPQIWLGKTEVRARMRIRTIRYRYLTPERLAIADRIASVVIAIFEGIGGSGLTNRKK